MSKEMDTIYDENIANEKLKQGTKYEKLAAIVFKILNQNDIVIHDLTLRGDGKTTGHQIDVTVQNSGSKVSKRILIECKDYDSKVGVGIVRDFFGAVHQIKPNEAFIVTTEGYARAARTFADDEGIKLAILRGFNEADWVGRIKSLPLKVAASIMDQPSLSWLAANKQEEEKYLANEEHNTKQNTNTVDTFFYDQAGTPLENLQTVLQPIFNSFQLNLNSPTVGHYEFDTIKYVKLAGVLVGVRGFEYKFTSSQLEYETIVDQGNKVALLVFKVLNGGFDQILFEQDLDKWTFDDGEVISK